MQTCHLSALLLSIEEYHHICIATDGLLSETDKEGTWNETKTQNIRLSAQGPWTPTLGCRH